MSQMRFSIRFPYIKIFPYHFCIHTENGCPGGFDPLLAGFFHRTDEPNYLVRYPYFYIFVSKIFDFTFLFFSPKSMPKSQLKMSGLFPLFHFSDLAKFQAFFSQNWHFHYSKRSPPFFHFFVTNSQNLIF